MGILDKKPEAKSEGISGGIWPFATLGIGKPAEVKKKIGKTSVNSKTHEDTGTGTVTPSFSWPFAATNKNEDEVKKARKGTSWPSPVPSTSGGENENEVKKARKISSKKRVEDISEPVQTKQLQPSSSRATSKSRVVRPSPAPSSLSGNNIHPSPTTESSIHSGNKGLADRILFLCTIIFVAATAALMKWDSYWPWVLLQSLSATAIVGGVADWYGVVSIYGRPLGISYKTEIIVQKRRELLTAIRSFVTEDLLSKKNITSKLLHYPLAQRLLKLLDHNREQDGPFYWLNNFLSAIIFNVVKNADEEEIAERLNTMLKRVVSRISPSEEIIRVARWMLTNNHDEKIFDALTPGMIGILKNAGFKSVMSDFTELFHSNYADDSWLRKHWGDFRSEVKESIFDLVASFLKELNADRQHPVRKDIKKWLHNALLKLEKDKAKQAAIDAWVTTLLDNPEVRIAIEDALHTLKESTFSEENCNDTVSLLLGKILDRLKKNKEMLRSANEWLFSKLTDALESNHSRIGDLVDASLNDMDDRELVAFVRDGTENDLQLIRVNGMIFGVLIGTVITLLRMWLA